MRLLSALYHNAQQASMHANTHALNANTFQRALLTAGSGLMAIMDPSRDDMISAFGELTGKYALQNVLKQMRNDAEGAQILRDRPIINSATIDLVALEKLPPTTFGYQYCKFLRDNNITPDSRKPILFVDDPDLAYVILRYRQIHDFTHCLLGMKTNMLGEVTVKVFEAIQLNLPMCWLGGLFGVLRLGPKHTEKYLSTHLDWIIENGKRSRPFINIYFEKHLERSFDDLKAECNLIDLQSFQSIKN